MRTSKIGVVRGRTIGPEFVRCEQIFILGQGQGVAHKHGHAEVKFAQKSAVIRHRYNGLAVVHAGKEASAQKVCKAMLALPDPTMLLVSDAPKVDPMVEELINKMRWDRRIVVVVGPSGEGIHKVGRVGSAMIVVTWPDKGDASVNVRKIK